MKKTLFLVLIISAFAFTRTVYSQEAITSSEVQAHIDFLASDKMKGRFTGSEELYKASEYIAKEFSSYGLSPFFSEGYFQEFPFVADVEMTPDNSLQINLSGKGESLKPKSDFITLPFSGASGLSSARLTFAGYGIDAPELKYNDYEGAEIKGRVLIVFTENPDSGNIHSRFERHTSLRNKTSVAMDKGAAGVIFISGYLEDEDKLPALRYDGAAGVKDFPVLFLKRSIAEKLFSSEGYELRNIWTEINNKKRPKSLSLQNSSVTLNTRIQIINKNSRNVAGILTGGDPVLKNEYIIIGAHFDHLGMGEKGSLYSGKTPQIHNGADDNASGVAGVLELAEYFSHLKQRPKRSLVFAAFSGEELGLLGSGYFTEHLPGVKINDIAVMINLDMIGRMDDKNTLVINGTGTSDIWPDLVKSKNNDYNFNLSLVSEGAGASDQSSFYLKGVPVLFFFTGIHPDYHRPTDDAEKINAPKEEKLLRYISDITQDIADRPARPQYVRIQSPAGEARTMRFNVYVGTIPDYASQQSEGFRISGVSEGSPAEKAGLKGGDIIVEFGGKKVNSIYDYMYAMSEFSAGDEVDIVVIRNGSRETHKVKLAPGKRR